MKRSKRQLFARFAGVTLLFCLGVLLLPELRAGVPREPIPEFVAEHLPADTFIRVHRSYIVNIDQIKTIERNRIVFGKLYIPISDSYKERFAEMLEKRTLN